MTTRIITFLGKSAKDTVYEYHGKTYEGNLFQVAMRHFLEFDEMDVFVTSDAKENFEKNLTPFDDPRIKAIDIRTGRTSEGLWNIFNAVVATISDGDTVIFDITHGLRSIPFLTFLVAAYLRSATDVKISSVLYGAFELGNPAPVIDLSDFVSLLDWLTATERFTQTGDGRPLANLLRQAGYIEHPKRQSLTPKEQSALDAAKRINLAASRIEEVSVSLLTNLILKSEVASHHLNIDLQKAESDLIAKAPPYRLVAENIRNSYLPFANVTPMQDIRKDLQLQLAMVRWYLDNGQIPQAATLMREWVVTALGYKFGLNSKQILAHKGKRRVIENILGRAVNIGRTGIDYTDEPVITEFEARFYKLENAATIAKFWSELTQFRNLINHGAMKNSWKEESEKVIKGLKKPGENGSIYTLYNELEKLAQTLIGDQDPDTGAPQ